ncbi:hypothetical protein BH11ACT2_BH11ACT2_05860 [soil metagenome]
MTGDPGQIIDAQLHLLDRQILDPDDTPVCTIDDVELDGAQLDESIAEGAPAPVITSLLSGPVLGTRIFGGRPPSSRLHRIPWSTVSEVGIVVRIGTRADELDVTWVERWVRDRIISRIPGGRHDPE